MQKFFVIFILIHFKVNFLFAYQNISALYGVVNKEFRYLSHKKEDFQTSRTSGVKDVANNESRFGMKGVHEETLFKADYKLEIGTNSNYDRGDGTSDDGSIHVRLARINFETKYGTFLFGQEYTATALPFLYLDPLWETGASMLGLDQQESIENMDRYLGHYYRSRKDLLGYKSPSFAGLQVTITVDKNASIFAPKKNETYDHYEINATYDWATNIIDGRFILGFVGGKPNQSTSPGYINETNILFGYHLLFDGLLSFSGGFQFYNKSSESVWIKDDKILRFMFATKYLFSDKDFLSFTYSDRREELTEQQRKIYTQFSLGIVHSFNKMISIRLTSSLVEANFEDFYAQDITAGLFSIGSTVKF